jgi:hypothetical protein
MAPAATRPVRAGKRRLCDEVCLRSVRDSNSIREFDYGELTLLPLVAQQQLSKQVVPRASAVVPGAVDAEPIVIHADHVNMVKFASREDNGFKTISGHLQIMAQSADDVISLRWAEEERVTLGR